MKLAGTLLTAGAVAGGVLAGLVVTNKVIEARAGELESALTGEERRYPWKYGDVFYKVKGEREAKPLLLIHGFGPGASSYAWRKNVDVLAEHFHVHVIDLLGFGMADRPKIDYSAETFVDLIGDFIKEVIGKPTVVVAHDLTCAYVIMDAYRRPQLFERLILVSAPASILQESRPGFIDSVRRFALRLPIAGQSIYNLLTTRRAIRRYLDRQEYHNPGLISDELVNYLFISAHQPRSRFAAASLLGRWLELDVYEPLARLQQPVLAIWGREGQATPAEEIAEAFKRVKPGIDTRILERARQQVQDEQAGQFNNLVREFAFQAVYQ